MSIPITARDILSLLGEVFPQGFTEISPPDQGLQIYYRIPIGPPNAPFETMHQIRITEDTTISVIDGWHRSWNNGPSMSEWLGAARCEWGQYTDAKPSGSFFERYLSHDSFTTDDRNSLIAWVSALRDHITGPEAPMFKVDGTLVAMPNAQKLAWHCPQLSSGNISNVSLCGFHYEPLATDVLFIRPGASTQGYFQNKTQHGTQIDIASKAIVQAVEQATCDTLKSLGLPHP